MCGIYFSCTHSEYKEPSVWLEKELRCRGPDHLRGLTFGPDREEPYYCPWYLTATSSVLSLRQECGAHQHVTPVTGKGISFLSWNGEVWRYSGKAVLSHDTTFIFNQLIAGARPLTSNAPFKATSRDLAIQSVLDVLARISGPYAFVFYDSTRQLLFYGRDVLGRRSLLRRRVPGQSLEIASVSGGKYDRGFEEVGADGVYVLDLALASTTGDAALLSCGRHLHESVRIPWQTSAASSNALYRLQSPFPSFNSTQVSEMDKLNQDSPAVLQLLAYLKSSLELRLRFTPVVDSIIPRRDSVAILFSGGLDCTLLARMAHDILPLFQDIDLINVAFENPRIVQAASKKILVGTISPSAYESCPDRMTGRASHAELVRLCPGRLWRFISIDISFNELAMHKPDIVILLQPHNTEMDFSIGCALYFAARGHGTVQLANYTTEECYTTPAKVLLSGLGADELFGGYARHAMAFKRRGHAGLVVELELDFQRIAERNLGRDDRIISHWSKEARYPFLDEDLVSWALRIPVHQKCGFGQAVEKDSVPDPCKRLLRLAAWKLGLRQAANQKKRAIQFGARTAKMEVGRTRGTQELSMTT